MLLKLNSLKCRVSFITLLFVYSSAFPQHHISRYEIRWAFFHPFASIKIKRILPEAMAVYADVKQQHLLDSFENGGKLDAFRHTYVMAFLARDIKPKKLYKLGIAHERGNKRQFEKKHVLEDGERPDSLSCEMDLRNNEVGITLGKSNSSLSKEELKVLVIQEIKKGTTWYIKRNQSGKYVTCNDEIIQFELYKSKWYIPKCLIRTDN